jgi:single-stranded-DNA-specific exonuclease
MAQARPGVDVIVVDHHKCSAELPAAALVNPNRLDESDEGAQFGHLAAVGVAFLLAVATVRELRGRAAFCTRAEPTCSPARSGRAGHGGRRRPRCAASTARWWRRASRSWRGARTSGMAALIDASRLKAARLLQRSRLCAGPAHQCGRAVGESDAGRAPAHHARPGRGARNRRMSFRAQRGAPRDRGGGAGGRRSADRASTTAPWPCWPGAAGIPA